MQTLLANTTLGPLDVTDVFVEYDGPHLLACRDRRGQLYLAVSVEDGPTSVIWLYVPVSEERLDQVQAASLDLHEAFAHPEGGSLLQVTTYRDGTVPHVQVLTESDIPADWLPSPGEFLTR